MDYETAKKNIDEICEWLSAGAPGTIKNVISETMEADIARNFCVDLLISANADGQCGCLLCQG